MENPRTWNEIKKTIYAAINNHRKETQQGVCGGSLVSAIYQKLLEDGHIDDPDTINRKERNAAIVSDMKLQEEEGGY